MKKFRNLKACSLAAILFLISGCESDFLDINKDPNNPTNVPNNQLLTTAELSMVTMLGMGGSGMSLAVSILAHQTVQRGSFDSYFVSGEDFNIQTAWPTLYSTSLINYDFIIKQGNAAGQKHYVGIAQILTAYSYSVMVDLWGDIPFTQALKADQFQFPEYDDDATIYPVLLTMLDEGIANLEASSDETVAGDIIYGGNVNKWRKFAKTLKLKLYNNIRLVDDVSAEVNALIAEGDLLGSNADDFELDYGTGISPDNRNPAFVNEYTLGSRPSYISPYFYEIMTNQSTLNTVLSGISDPRVPYYWFKQLTDPADAQNATEYTDDNGFLSIYFASQGVNQGFQQDRSLTVLGLYPIGGRYDDGDGGIVNVSGDVSGPGNVAQRLLTYSTLLYTQAELALTEAGVTGNARDLFEDAMYASFDKVNEIADAADAPLIGNTAVANYVNAVLTKYDAANASGKLELIMTEKWIANFGCAIESYNDIRRTGFPKPFDPNNDGIAFTVTNRLYPLSLAYDNNSLNTNLNAPDQKNVTTANVFWDAN